MLLEELLYLLDLQNNLSGTNSALFVKLVTIKTFLISVFKYLIIWARKYYVPILMVRIKAKHLKQA